MNEPIQLALFQVPDIAFEIAILLDNDSLRKLSALPLWCLFQAVITSRLDHFWKRRIELAHCRTLGLQPLVDWKRVYYSLEGNIREVFEYLPSLLVFREVGGEVCALPSYFIWSSISCPSVLSYLVERELISTKLIDITAGLVSIAERGLMEMVDPVLALIKAEHDTDMEGVVHSALCEVVRTQQLSMVQKLFGVLKTVTVDHILSIASAHGHPSVVLWLLDTACVDDTIPDLIRRAIMRGQAELVTELISRMIPFPSAPELDAMLVYAVRAGKIDISELLRQLGAGSRTSAIDWFELMLDTVTDSDLPEMVAYLLSISPVEHLPSELLSIAAGRGETIFRIVLSDRRLDPIENLTQTLRAITGVQNLGEVMSSPCLSTARRSESGLDLILALVRCEWFRVEKLDVVSVRLVLWSLYTVIWPKIEGFCEGGRRAGGGTTPRQLSDLLESQSVLALVTRFLLIKNPTSSELCDWMLTCQEPLFETAARHVLSGELSTDNTELVSIEALLLALLYPTLTLPSLLSVSLLAIVSTLVGFSDYGSRAKQGQDESRVVRSGDSNRERG